ncbi:MAG: protein-methionine-sulfoxide reductase heme-binding subunit MsrQ [Pseudohongiellaceae bacterium]|nr:protein-methionine-sulfoxide reductase heme-binding subunit MsrQ [Pseudohongiellaceae bacterium]
MIKAIRLGVFCASLIPFAYLLYGALTNTLGPDPADTLAVSTGEWAFRFLLMSLAITPLRALFKEPKLMPYRRTFGLFALFYASVHFLVYLVFLLQLRWSEISEDILERPYITVGFTAFVLLVALGATSNKFMMRRLGRRWKRLHSSVYLINVLVLIHLLWILRTDLAEAVFYGSILLPLLMYRLVKYLLARRASQAKSLSRA